MRKEQNDLKMQQSIQGYTLQREDEAGATNNIHGSQAGLELSEKGQFIPFAEALKKLG